MTEIVSPLTGDDCVSLQRRIDIEKLKSDYRKEFSIDISRYVAGIDSLSLYKCDKTGYRFYHPFGISGDGAFYALLEQNDWYYMDTKWEHDQALKDIKAGDRILEIGAARGSFLLRAKGIDRVTCVGLELNQSAASIARERGIDVFIEQAEDHAVTNHDEYDVICMFQVLEHISHPIPILEAVMRMLKKGGRLIIAVPDNSVRATSSLFVSEDNILNMPPHHLGLWDIISLSSLIRIFPMDLEYLMVEPAMATYQMNYYRGLLKSNLKKKYGMLGLGVYFSIRPLLINVINRLSPFLPAHTVLASYIKH